MNTLPSTDTALIADIRPLIDHARQQAAVAVNAALTRLYWQVGQQMHNEILHGERAALWAADDCNPVVKIDRRIWQGLGGASLEKRPAHRGTISRRVHDAHTVCRIELVAKKQEQIELLERDKSGIHVAEYLTILPSRARLQAKLQQSMAVARQRLLQDRGET